MTEKVFAYAAVLAPQKDGEIVVSFRDLPEALTSGADEAEALAEASDALDEAVAARIANGEDIPAPTRMRRGERLVRVPPLMAAKASLHMEMIRTATSKSDLARRLGCDEKEVRRLLDPRHASKVERIQDALSELGATLEVRLINADNAEAKKAKAA